jgi:hypothetical protein
MFTRFSQNQAPEVRELDPIPPPLPTNTLARPFETVIPAEPFKTVVPAEPSLQNDSGYDSLARDSLCTCQQDLCLKCGTLASVQEMDGGMRWDDMLNP